MFQQGLQLNLTEQFGWNYFWYFWLDNYWIRSDDTWKAVLYFARDPRIVNDDKSAPLNRKSPDFNEIFQFWPAWIVKGQGSILTALRSHPIPYMALPFTFTLIVSPQCPNNRTYIVYRYTISPEYRQSAGTLYASFISTLSVQDCFYLVNRDLLVLVR